MTEQTIRTISRFLRTVYSGEINAVAQILNTEAELLSGREGTDVLVHYLYSVISQCNKWIDQLQDGDETCEHWDKSKVTNKRKVKF